MITPFCMQQFTATQFETSPQFCTNFIWLPHSASGNL